MSSSTMPGLAEATALQDTDRPGCYRIELDAAWTANGHCTAGYLASVLARAALQDRRAPFARVGTVSIRYLRMSAPGPATVQVDPLRLGGGGADWLVTLQAADEPRVAALVSTGHGSAPGRRVPPPSLPAEDRCVLLPTRAAGLDLPVMAAMAQYADPTGLTWLTGESSRRGLAQGWIRFTDDSDPDQLSLLAAFDSIPTATMDLGLEGWAATLDMSIHLLGSPAAGPLRLRRTVHETADDLVTLTCDLWDAGSALVATGRQLCRLRR